MNKQECFDIQRKAFEKGKVLCCTCEGLVEYKIEDLVNQPTNGLLYDLNRDQATILTTFPVGMIINELATINVLKYLHEQYQKKNNFKTYTKMAKVKIKKLNPNAVIPFRKHDDDYCYDCVAVSEEEVAPNVWKYGLGFALQIKGNKLSSINRCFTIRPRSSVWKTGMVLSNSIATIDEGFTGEISTVFYHVMPNMPRYKAGDRICQLHFDSDLAIDFTEVDELNETERGDGGYGSTGLKG